MYLNFTSLCFVLVLYHEIAKTGCKQWMAVLGGSSSKGGVLGTGRGTCVLVPVRDDASINLIQLTVNEL